MFLFCQVIIVIICYLKVEIPFCYKVTIICVTKFFYIIIIINVNLLHFQYSLQVAEEVLLAERGGQWLLSCYGPFKERKSIPGMEDVSPEEVRWEMYQAQKSGTVDQIVRFLFTWMDFLLG